jgi:phage terminase large subunit-like protein
LFDSLGSRRALWAGILARPEQIPTDDLSWSIWLYLAGRGAGKTRTAAEWIVWKALDNPKTRWAVIAPTFGDVRDTCAEGESGMINIIKQYDALDFYNRSTGDIRLKNGSRIKLFSADEPDRLRGPQHHGAWMEELAAWRYPETYDQAQFGLRLGKHPQTIITTTPRPIKLIRSLVARDDGSVRVVRGSTFDNATNLAPQALIELQLRYAGTRLGRQELYGEILEDTEGALWTRKMIDDARILTLPPMTRIVVAIDPAVTSGEDSDQTGITVSGRTPDGHYYVLESVGLRVSPDAWARRAIELYHKFKADRIVAEKNNGGDMIELLLKAVDPTVPVKLVTATRGKHVRAEPISSLYEQCVAKGTLISSERGLVPIEEITVGERVWTRKGLKKVLWSGQTGIKETITLTTPLGELTCTPDHPIYTVNKDFVDAEHIDLVSDKLLVWNPLVLIAPNLLANAEIVANPVQQLIDGLLADNLNGNMKPLIGLDITNSQTLITEPEGTQVMSSYTGRNGKHILATSRQVGTSITKTIMPAIMTLPIWSRCRPKNTLVKHTLIDVIERILKNSKIKLKGLLGGLNANLKHTFAIGAKLNTKQLPQELDSVLPSATLVTGVTKLSKNVLQPVYNLEVEDQPEFFANGILVHNCRVHHYQGADLAALEDQMVSWTPESKESPDLLDSLVWGITELSVASPAMQYLASRVDFCPSCRMPVPKGSTVCPKCQAEI